MIRDVVVLLLSRMCRHSSFGSDDSCLACGSLQVVEGGFASQAGLEVGDVIVAISGVFGEMSHVLGSGIDKV